MVMTTNRGWRSWRRDDWRASEGQAPTRDEVAEIVAEQLRLATPRGDETTDEVRDPSPRDRRSSRFTDGRRS